ncbi:hypothetical protein [Mucilaginibacter pineti]|nr:hypothetical protein [Mucilaginibacter pineti]
MRVKEEAQYRLPRRVTKNLEDEAGILSKQYTSNWQDITVAK